MPRMLALALALILTLAVAACDVKDRPSPAQENGEQERVEESSRDPQPDQDERDDASSDPSAPDAEDGELPLEPGEIRIVRDLKDRGPIQFRLIPMAQPGIHASWTLEVDGERYGLSDIAEEADEQVLLTVEDMNGDGVDDFRIRADLPAGVNRPYHYFLWSSSYQRFALNESLSSITSPQFINGEIRSFWRDSATAWGNKSYIWDESGEGVILIREETWDAADQKILDTYGDGYARYQMKEFDPETGEETLSLDQAEMVE